MYISFVLSYRCRGDECQEMSGGVCRCVRKLFTRLWMERDTTLNEVADTEANGQTLNNPFYMPNLYNSYSIIHSFRTEIF